MPGLSQVPGRDSPYLWSTAGSQSPGSHPDIMTTVMVDSCESILQGKSVAGAVKEFQTR